MDKDVEVEIVLKFAGKIKDFLYHRGLINQFLKLRNRGQCPRGHACRDRRCYKSCGRSRNCNSANLECVHNICRLKDGCGEQFNDCLENEYCEDG